MLTSSFDERDVFYFKQKTAYEMRISDWSSDVCSSDLDMMDETKAVALAQKILEGFNRGEVSSIAGCFHSDVQAEFPYAPPGMSAICSGHSAVVATFKSGRA